jgi:S13-like H2TH domain
VQPDRRTTGARARSPEQRERALAKANEVRLARARLKRDLTAGRIELARVLNDPPPCAQTAKLRDLLLAVPKIGPARVTRTLAHCRIADSKTSAGLSDRQRAALIQLLHH